MVGLAPGDDAPVESAGSLSPRPVKSIEPPADAPQPVAAQASSPAADTAAAAPAGPSQPAPKAASDVGPSPTAPSKPAPAVGSQRTVVVVILAIAAIVIAALALSGGPDQQRSPGSKPAADGVGKKTPAQAPAPAKPAAAANTAAKADPEQAAAKKEKAEKDENQAEAAEAAAEKDDDTAHEESASSDSVAVKVKVEPTTAIVFRGGERLGTGEVTVNVNKGETVKLVVLHRGYNYRRVKLDGSKTEVHVRLLEIPGEEEGAE